MSDLLLGGAGDILGARSDKGLEAPLYRTRLSVRHLFTPVLGVIQSRAYSQAYPGFCWGEGRPIGCAALNGADLGVQLLLIQTFSHFLCSPSPTSLSLKTQFLLRVFWGFTVGLDVLFVSSS